MSTQIEPRTDDHGTGQAGDSHDLSPTELLRRLYALFHNKRFGLLLILAMAVLTLFGVLFPQAPGDALADPASREAWLETVRPRYRGWTDILATLGIFGVFGSLAFKVVTVTLALSIVACTTHRFPQLWKQAHHPHTHVRPTFFDHARTQGTALVAADANVTAGAVKAALHRHRFRTLADADGTPLYADRNRFAPFGTVVAHAAFVVILAGVLVTSTFGFRIDDLSVPVGSRVEVGQGTGLAVEARSFTDSYNPDGSPSDYVSDLVLYSEGAQVAEQIVRVNAPLDWQGWSLNQASFGIAADLKVTDAAGATLFDGALPLEYQLEGQYSYGKATIEGTDLLVYVITPASGRVVPDIPAGQAQIEVYAGGTDSPVFSSLVPPGQPVEGAGHAWTFVRERQYTGLMLSRDPGAPIVWIGSALLAIGTCWTMFLRHQRLWIRLEPGPDGTRVTLASPDRHDTAFARQVNELVAGLGDTPAPPTTRKK
ncbi:MAG: cytochrome c biogenesis protein ResB [Propionibacteriaceae bacterium]|nr:cytochrome c biogenesis protein ResB [Propionibacteriaceae bacterium]